MEIGIQQQKEIRQHLIEIYGKDVVDECWDIVMDTIDITQQKLAKKLPIQIVSCSGVCDGKCIINNTTNMCMRCGKEYNENNCN